MAETKAELAYLTKLFKLMREQKVFVFRHNGMEVQLSQTAFDQPIPKMPVGPPQPYPISPEIAGPFQAMNSNVQAGINHTHQPWLTPPVGNLPEPFYDPTDPEQPVDDSMLYGSNIPDGING